jgi:hypothetical protein
MPPREHGGPGGTAPAAFTLAGDGSAPCIPEPRGGILEGRQRRLDGRWSRQRDGRKVRAPQGRVLGNAQGGKPHGKCHRKQTAARKSGKGETVR